MESAIVLSDLHYPYHDPKYVNIATKLIKLLKPDHVIGLGVNVEERLILALESAIAPLL